MDRNVFRGQKQSHRLDDNYRGLQSLKSVEQYFQTRVIGAKKWYLCEYGGRCAYRSPRTTHIARHINLVHIKACRFPCGLRGCGRVYGDPDKRRQHRIDHMCGFGIRNGRTMTTECGNRSIYRFRQRVTVDRRLHYKCSFMDCQFLTVDNMSIKRHIHSQHLCPNRVVVTECPQMSHENQGFIGNALTVNEDTDGNEDNSRVNGEEIEIIVDSHLFCS